MTTDELLLKLPSHIGSKKLLDKDGKCSNIGWLYLHNDGGTWLASYGEEGDFVCLNPEAKEPPYNNACAFGKTPNEALQRLYDWCVKNGFIQYN